MTDEWHAAGLNPHRTPEEIPMNPLDQYPQARSALYLLQWVANGVLTIAGVIFLTLGTPADQLPLWYVLALAIAPVLWTYLGVTAQRNTPSYRDVVEGSVPPAAERGATDTESVAVTLALLFAAMLLALLVTWR